MSVRRTGDWQQARKLLAAAPERLRRATERAVRQEAQLLRKHIVEGITSQAPGGEPFAPLAPTTIAARQLAGFSGTKALIRNADLLRSIVVVMDGDDAFVGVHRKARSRDGHPLTNVAEAHEFGKGPFVVPLTPKMRRFLFLLLKRAGIEPRSDGTGAGVVVVQIPARPFMRPAFTRFRKGAQRRFLQRVAEQLGWGGL